MIFILGFIAALLFVYWVYSEPSNRVDKVRIGMTQQDVRKLLGPPRASEGVTIKQNYRREALFSGSLRASAEGMFFRSELFLKTTRLPR